ncbi:UNVERIFIED_CONTAM: hypothetical protein Scaly_1426600 [Sesamum calycinum]|uniref:Retrotransposon Copia-like N-terminal domain-containing protein n=1 Tax=Sesamum calycinum TaxID=2727403 RepID=A0AAW2PMF8_9LAMI
MKEMLENAGAAGDERIRSAVDERVRNVVNKRLRKDANFLQMHKIEGSSMSIVTALMDGKNYLAWSRAIKLALQGRMILCFIDRTSEKLNRGDENYDKWIRVDSMGPLSVVDHYDKTTAESNTLNQLMQFLIGLDDAYDHIRSQILAIEPLSSVNKAFSMVQRVEKQQKLNCLNTEPTEEIALNVRWSGTWGRN